jgi:hypothetical protein
MSHLFVIFTAAILALPAQAAPPPPEQLLQEADRARGVGEGGLTWTVVVEATEDGETTRRIFLIRTRGSDALAETRAPDRARGELLLFSDGNLWFFKPGLRKPVAISARQRLSGEASNGDIARTRFAHDYEATHAGEELVDGEETWKLELKARGKSVTYDRIRYWVSKSRRLGVKAEFLTVSGEVLKVATFEYGNSLETATGAIPFLSQTRISDAVVPTNFTVLRFNAPRREDHPATLFNVNDVTR